MTTPTISCEQFAEHLADFLEREVDEPTRARIELHALGCIPCGELLADLRKLRIDAANLPELAPSRDLWAGIAERIETPVVVLTPGGRIAGEAPRPRRTRHLGQRFMSLWIGAAAAALVVTTAIVTHQVTTRSLVVATTGPSGASAKPADSLPATQAATAPTAQSPAASNGTDSASTLRATSPKSKATTTLASNRPSAEATYDMEIKRLRAIIAQRKSTLDTATVHVIERNLKVIDDAIAQCKQALQKDPASRFLMESLNDALDTKVQLLRTAAMLPART